MIIIRYSDPLGKGSPKAQTRTRTPKLQTLNVQGSCGSEGVPFRVLFIRVPYYLGDRRRDPKLENHPTLNPKTLDS